MNQNSEQVASTEEEKKQQQQLPLGYKFRPTPEEIIQYFLFNKLLGSLLHPEKIIDLDIDQFDPHQLPFDQFHSEKRGYFFAPAKIRKSPKHTPNGYWKIDEEEIPVYGSEDRIIGFKDKLSFYSNDTPTDWKMTEYRCNLDGHNNVEEKYIVCKVEYKIKVENTFTNNLNVVDEEDDSEEDNE